MRIRGPEIGVMLVLIALVVLVGYAYFATRPTQEPAFEPPQPLEQPAEEVQPPAQEGGAPVIELSERDHDFGTVEPDQVVEHAFSIENKGDAILRIEGLRTSCSCVTLHASSLAVPPEGTADLVAELNPQHYGGPSPNITAYVHTNDPRTQVTVLTVSAEITPEFVVEPQAIDFGTLPKGTGASRTFRLRQTWREPVKITSVETMPDSVVAFYSETTVSGPQESSPPMAVYDVEVRLKPDAPGGVLNGFVTLQTNVKRVPLVRVPVKAVVEGGVSVVPNIFFFAARVGATESLGSIDIYSESPFLVAGVESDVTGLEWKAKTAGQRPVHSVVANLQPGARPGERVGSVTVKLQQAARDKIVVPVAGVVLDKGMQE